MEAKKNCGSLNRTSAATKSGMHAGNTVPGAVINNVKGFATGTNPDADALGVVINVAKRGTITNDPKEYIHSEDKMYTMLNWAFAPFYIVGVNLGMNVDSPLDFCVSLAVAGIIPTENIKFYAHGIEAEIGNWTNAKGKIVKVGDMVSHAKMKEKINPGFISNKTVRTIQATEHVYELAKDVLDDIQFEQEKKASAEKQLDDIIMSESDKPIETQVNILYAEIGKRASTSAKKIIDDYLLNKKKDLLMSVVIRLMYDHVDEEEEDSVKELLEKVALIAAEKDITK